MKKIFFIVAIMATVFTQKSIAQYTAQQYQLPQLLTHYYNIKNALVVGDANAASANALAFVKAINSIANKVISVENVYTLANDAGKITESKDIKKQRDYLANFSKNMANVAKLVNLFRPAYLSGILSNEKSVMA